MNISRLSSDRTSFWLIFVVCLLIFSRNLSTLGLEYRDDEVRYFKSTVEMHEQKNYLSPTYLGKPRFQKPILFYWFILFFYKIFGVGWFSARFPAAVCASFVVGLTWLLVKEIFQQDRKMAGLSALVLTSTILFFRHAQNAVPDMVMNFFIVVALFSLWRFLQQPERRSWKILFFLCSALGFMTKGFAAVVVPVGTFVLYSLVMRKPRWLLKINFPLGILILSFIILPWFLYMLHLHGDAFSNHLFVQEWQKRVVSGGETSGWIKTIMVLKRNIPFYFEKLMTYGAPWNVYLLFAIPLCIRKVWQGKSREGVLFFGIWFFVAFIFFSAIPEAKQHYLLVLTTPYAVIITLFLIEPFAEKRFINYGVVFLRKYWILLILGAGFLGFSFLWVFLAGSSKLWLVFFLGLFCVLSWKISKTQSLVVAPAILAVFMVFVLSQSKLMVRLGFAPHGTTQKLAQTVHLNFNNEAIIGTGSYDIHEKVVQVYFNRPVIKAGWDDDARTKREVNELFAHSGDVYCLILEKDYKKFISHEHQQISRILQEEYTPRRRLNLDFAFLKALVRLDQNRVRKYFLEKVFLIYKPAKNVTTNRLSDKVS